MSLTPLILPPVPAAVRLVDRLPASSKARTGLDISGGYVAAGGNAVQERPPGNVCECFSGGVIAGLDPAIQQTMK
jgi:hypothetical protein